MNIISDDAKQSVSLGGIDNWQTLQSTIRYHLSSSRSQLSHVFSFLDSGRIASSDCLAAAREFNLVRDALSQIPPSEVIYDEKDPNMQPPWGDQISPVITSCANYFTSGDGDDLLAEIVRVFTYAAYADTDVTIV